MDLTQLLIEQAGKSDLAACTKLIKLGAHVNGHDVQGKTPLHHAAASEDVGILQLLLDHGAQADTRDYFGWSPLHSTVYLGHIAYSELLLSHGADIEIKDADGSSPLILAMKYGRKAMFFYLIDCGADSSGVSAILDTESFNHQFPDFSDAVNAWMAGRSARDAIAQGVKAPSPSK